jgi:hypothetical protein
VSNPYGGPPGPPADHEPGEPGASSPYSPYGSSAYGGPASPYGPTGTARSTDPVSITGFVLSLLCCTGFVGVILGIVGLRRTKNGVRKGRWAAVAAIAVGVVSTVLFASTVAFFTWFGTSTVLLDSADVGQCVNVDELSGNDATLFKKDCDEPHEAEVVVADEFDQDLIDAFLPGFPAGVCSGLLDEEYSAAFTTGEYDLGLVFEATEPERGDDFICYLERSDGDDLDEPVVD